MGTESLKQVACQAIDDATKDLHELSDRIWANPELGFKEKFAHDTLTKFLTDTGFKTKRSFKLETAFMATFTNQSNKDKESCDGERSRNSDKSRDDEKTRETGPNVCFISEYDALPGIGHACGHNLIAEVGVAAGIGLRAAMKAYGKPCGQVTVIGTPAEEGFGGKVDLIDVGAFDGVDLAMMAHPFPDYDPEPVMLARENFRVTFHGRSSHASGFPWEGINALDAAVSCYNTIACLRQQIKPTCRLHCIMREGGVRINIIPEKAVLEVCVRAPSDKERSSLKQRVLACVEAAAIATGCSVEHETMDKVYSSVMHNTQMVTLYEANMAPFLTEEIPRARAQICGSTDLGNVAHLIPCIHPHFHIGGKEVNHTRGFTADAGHTRAQRYTLHQAKALAMTGVDIMFNANHLQAIKDTFTSQLKLEKE